MTWVPRDDRRVVGTGGGEPCGRGGEDPFEPKREEALVRNVPHDRVLSGTGPVPRLVGRSEPWLCLTVVNYTEANFKILVRRLCRGVGQGREGGASEWNPPFVYTDSTGKEVSLTGVSLLPGPAVGSLEVSLHRPTVLSLPVHTRPRPPHPLRRPTTDIPRPTDLRGTRTPERLHRPQRGKPPSTFHSSSFLNGIYYLVGGR